MVKMFCVYDSKVEAYLQPFFMSKRGEALRAWETTCNDSKSGIARYPADYTLFEIGEFDDSKGCVTMYESKVSLGVATEFVKKQNVTPLEEHINSLKIAKEGK